MRKKMTDSCNARPSTYTELTTVVWWYFT